MAHKLTVLSKFGTQGKLSLRRRPAKLPVDLCMYQCQVPEAGRSGYPPGFFDCEVCLQVGDFDMTTILDDEEGLEVNP